MKKIIFILFILLTNQTILANWIDDIPEGFFVGDPRPVGGAYFASTKTGHKALTECENSTENITQKSKNFLSKGSEIKNENFMGFNEAHKQALLFLCNYFPKTTEDDKNGGIIQAKIYNTISQIIPVYLPKYNEPLGFWYIFTEHNNAQSARFFPNSIYQKRDAMWFLGGHASPYKNYFSAIREYTYYHEEFLQGKIFTWFPPQSPEYSDKIYQASLSEPFSSAHELQMYYYMGRPLLVARDQTGQVIQARFQLDYPHEESMERAKNYLGEKFYHP